MKLLFKYPSRGRPLLFVKTLHYWLHLMSGKYDCDFVVAMDLDDETMNNDLIRDCINQLDDASPRACVSYYYKKHDGIVEAVNSNLLSYDADIYMAISDGMEPTQANYDERIVDAMRAAWPGMDGAIYFNDGECGKRFAIAPIMGKALLHERGHFFDPFFKWGEADRDATVILRAAGKLRYYEEVLFIHNGIHHKDDEVYNRTRQLRIDDHRKYKVRRKQGYYVFMDEKQQTLREYAWRFGTHVFIETGTFKGDTVKAMLAGEFDRICTVDAVEERAIRAKNRFKDFARVGCNHGESPEFLKSYLPTVNEPALFWLDAHYVGAKGDNGKIGTPVMDELDVILARNFSDVILIDDARLFTPGKDYLDGYPTLEEIRLKVYGNHPDWAFEVTDDIIRIYSVSDTDATVG